jgi:hypothetical protein
MDVPPNFTRPQTTRRGVGCIFGRFFERAAMSADRADINGEHGAGRFDDRGLHEAAFF